MSATKQQPAQKIRWEIGGIGTDEHPAPKTDFQAGDIVIAKIEIGDINLRTLLKYAETARFVEYKNLHYPTPYGVFERLDGSKVEIMLSEQVIRNLRVIKVSE